MARKLKTYQTSLGFFDLAVAAPSMKAALEAWGADSNLFHQGAAKQSKDPDVIEATMAAPGVVLKRPVGSSGRFAEQSELPTDLDGDGVGDRRGKSHTRSKKRPPSKISEKSARKAALDLETERKRREAERRREEAAASKQRERRDQAIKKAQTALDDSRRHHEARANAIEAERAAVEKRAHDEEARWERQREKLDAALRRARDSGK